MYRTRSGSVLLTALAIVTIGTIILGGAATLVASYNVRVQRDADYQAALQLAEAGINAELAHISRYVQTPPGLRGNMVAAHSAANPLTGSVSGVEGSFSVYVFDATTGGTWVPPHAMKVRATGMVGRATAPSSLIKRSIEITGQKKGIFGDFSFYGISEATLNGSDSHVDGNAGTNGQYFATAGAAAIYGSLLLAGPGATGPVGNNVVMSADPVQWPTVDEIIDATIPGGWSYLAAHNDNGKLRQYAKNHPSLTYAGTISAGWATSGTASTTIRTNDLNKFNTGPTGKKTLIFPPGDYYLTDIQVSGSATLVFDTAGMTLNPPAPGPVRLWMQSTSNKDSQDTINCDVVYTTETGKDFQAYANARIYYNKKAELSLAGTSLMNGGFYGVRADGQASIKVSGNSGTRGSVIANAARVAGNSFVQYPSDGLLSNDADYYLWYGFGEAWRETAATGRKVFTDGTDY